MAPILLATSAAAAQGGSSGQGGETASSLIDGQRTSLRAATRSCSGEDGEIVVCGRRGSDRFRVPLEAAPGARESVRAERDRMLRMPCAVGLHGCGPNLTPVLTFGSDGSTKWGPVKDPAE